MEFKIENMVSWEREKACYLLDVAEDVLGMDAAGYGELAVNPNSGYTYLWLEDYPFVLYMPIVCELELTDVWVMWTDPENGTEYERTLDYATLDELYGWAALQEKA